MSKFKQYGANSHHQTKMSLRNKNATFLTSCFFVKTKFLRLLTRTLRVWKRNI